MKTQIWLTKHETANKIDISITYENAVLKVSVAVVNISTKFDTKANLLALFEAILL